MAASATFALKPGVWFRRSRRCMVSPDPLGTACPPSGRNSTYRPVQIPEAGSILDGGTDFDIIAIDIPIGLLDAYEIGGRACDRAARKFLGKPRGNSIFPAPVRPVLAATLWHVFARGRARLAASRSLNRL